MYYPSLHVNLRSHIFSSFFFVFFLNEEYVVFFNLSASDAKQLNSGVFLPRRLTVFRVFLLATLFTHIKGILNRAREVAKRSVAESSGLH